MEGVSAWVLSVQHADLVLRKVYFSSAISTGLTLSTMSFPSTFGSFCCN